jgi:hypothetical protein
MIPLTGQGKPLPADCPYRGEWLLENTLFLFRGDDFASQSDSPRFTPGFQRPDGEWCTGFDSSVLARGLGVEIKDLFNTNRNGSLILATVEEVAPQHGGSAAKRYVFALGNKISMITIEAIQSGGNA